MLIIFEGFAACLGLRPARIQILLGAEAIIRLALFNKLLCIGKIHIFSLALNVRTVVSALVRALVPFKSRKSQAAVNFFNRTFNKTRLIGILNAENKHAIVLFCKQISV